MRSDIIPIILKLLRRISSGKKDRNFRAENQDYKKLGQGRISNSMELYTPLLQVLAAWLNSNPNYEEVTAWYQGWTTTVNLTVF